MNTQTRKAIGVLVASLPLPLTAQDFLEPVVVTGSRLLEPLKDTPVRTEVLDSKILQNRGLRSLAEAIEYSPGVRIDTACQNCSQQSIQMLGLPQQYIGILNDGLPNFSTLAGVYGIEQIPAGLIGRIEIVKGGGSVLYGPGAVAGVINLIPRDPVKSGGQFSTRMLGVRGDSFGEKAGGSAFGLYDYVNPDSTFKATIFGGSDRIQPIDRDGDGFTDVSMRDLWTGGLRAVWKPNLEHQLSLDYFISDESRRGGEIATFDLAPNESLIAEEIFSRRNVTTAKWLANWSETLDTSLAYSFSRTKRDSYYGGIGALGSPDTNSPFFEPAWTAGRGFGTTQDDLHFVDALANWSPSAEHRFTFGTQFRHETIIDDQLSANRSIDESFSNFGVLMQHRYTPSDMWTIEYGSRMDLHSEVADPIFSPRAAVLYSANDDFRIRSAVSTGFRAPEVFDEDLHIANVGGELSTTFNNPDLQEESSLTVSISPEWQVSEAWRLEANFFHTWLDDTLVVEPNDDLATPSVREFQRTNGESSRIFGAEFNLGYYQPNWQVEFSWVEQRLEFNNPQLILGDDSFSDPIDNPVFSSSYTRVPDSLGLLRFSYDTPWFDLFVTGKLTGPMDIPRILSDSANGDPRGNRMQRSDWSFNVDVGISREFELRGGSLTASLGVQNLLDDFQNDLDQGVFRDASYVYGPAFPRTIFAGLKYEF